MKFGELKFGDVFKFKWEEDRDWIYEKVGYDRIKCVQAPITHSHVAGRIDSWKDQDQEVILNKQSTTYVYVVEATEYGDDHPSYRVAFKDKNQAEFYCGKLNKSFVFSFADIKEIELL